MGTGVLWLLTFGFLELVKYWIL
nr:hypothetical protein [Acetivibrio saccincola]